jgi:predicted DCC family thiol-disulfide oxidoreductase YuxK
MRLPQAMTTAPAPVLLYDGTCGFCARSVQFVLERDRKRTLRFAALDSAFGRAVIDRHPELRGIDSVLYVEPSDPNGDERVFAYSAAATRVASYLGGGWRLFQLIGIVPAAIRDAVYRLIARHRHMLSGNRPRCLIPSPQDRARFLE